MEQRETWGGRQLLFLPGKTSTRLIWPDSAIAKVSQTPQRWGLPLPAESKSCMENSVQSALVSAALPLMSLFIRQDRAPGEAQGKISNKARSVKCWEAAGTSPCCDYFQQEEEEGCLRSHEELPDHDRFGIRQPSRSSKYVLQRMQ